MKLEVIWSVAPVSIIHDLLEVDEGVQEIPEVAEALGPDESVVLF
ncbi:hypothetical protein GCM10007933_43140 [Zoogloea oryzae]|uniref:Uncharacterized protein n=1 Tax=Zoogloea oryzae TaxID=310767 RepID=A0ABQ6FKR7_9RHOO|nr:hypothetical protein GCM10007933_43140 [Zoogloea oryzae]